MSKWSNAVGLTLLTLPLIAAAYTNEPDGFRGINWGSEFALNAAEMTVVDKGKDMTFYLRKGDKLSIGGAELANVTYGYWRGNFQAVMMKSSGIANKSALIAAFREQFGNPFQPNQFLDQYYWRGAITTILVDCSPIGNNCSASLFSTRGLNQQEEEKHKAAAGAKKDF